MQNNTIIKSLCDQIKQKNLIDLFNQNNNRVFENTIKFEEMIFDYSKNYINQEILNAFIDQATKIGLEEYRDKMFAGEKINFTENRAVLHVALRDKNLKSVMVDGINYYDQIWSTLERMLNFADQVRYGIIKGYTGKAFTDIINIGIGGSSLPLQMAYEALLPYKQDNINVHFVSNVDYSDLYEKIKYLNPETTLILVASKTFTTEETMLNANSAKKWIINAMSDNAIAKHFVALSTNLDEVAKFGINSDYIFGFWDFVGGRYSLWSSIGLSVAIAIGKNNFLDLLNGASLADQHFKTAHLSKNIPFIMAILGIIYRNYFDYRAEAILPYSKYLSRFSVYLQQVNMESNGKSINKNGLPVEMKTGPIVFGEPGTDAQHSFYQLLHQGTDIIPVDLIGFIKPHADEIPHQDVLIANLIAQAEAFMLGKNEKQVINELSKQGLSNDMINKLVPHKIFKGNRPSNVFLFDQLTPKNLGILCALYEHKIFIQGVFWQINPFDQWGVELGKQLAKVIFKDIISNEIKTHDESTKFLINYYKSNK